MKNLTKVILGIVLLSLVVGGTLMFSAQSVEATTYWMGFVDNCYISCYNACASDTDYIGCMSTCLTTCTDPIRVNEDQVVYG